MKRTHWLPFFALILAPGCVAEWHDTDDEWEWEDEPCDNCSIPDAGTPDECPDPTDALFLATSGHGCAGIEFTCPAGYDPFRADCGCGCVIHEEPPPPSCEETVADQHFYVSRDAKVCGSVSFTCPTDQARFDSECGCGCWIPPAPICPDESDPRVHYLGDDPSVCAQITFTCPEGCSAFNDECGCGCIEPTPTEPICPDRNDPKIHYLGEDPTICAQIDFTCEPGCIPFDDECGCGCIEP